MRNNDLFTGERFIPGIDDVKLEIEHIQRYLSVESLVKDKDVLDAACGEGYGSSILANSAKSVIGIDIDEATIDRAVQSYAVKNNLRYMQGNVEKINLPDHSIDVVISFETIEHIGEEAQKKFLAEIARVLKENGFLIMSTPNKAVYSDRHDYNNEFHIKEFYFDEFVKFLKSKFKYIELYNQAFQVMSVINKCCNTETEIQCYRNGRHYSNNGKYYIAIASQVEIRQDNLSSIYINDDNEYESLIDRLISLQNEEEERNNHIFKLDERIKTADERIVELQGEEEKRNQHINLLNETIQHKDEVLDSYRESMEDKRQVIELYKQKIQQKQGELQAREEQFRLQNNELALKEEQLQLQQGELAEKDRQLQSQQDDLAEREGQIKSQNSIIEQQHLEIMDLQQVIKNKEGHIELLLESERAYEREKKTHSYKFAKRIQKVGNFLLPPNSKRRFFFRIIFNFFRHPMLMLHVVNIKRVRNYIKYIRLEGMEGVKKRYEEAVAIEKMQNIRKGSMEVDIDELPKKQKDIKEHEKIVLPQYASPIVSIIIPVFNEFEYTYNCIKSIAKNSGNVAYEVIVADDCSTDLTVNISKIIENIKVVTTKENLRFLLNCNHAAKEAKGKYILFLNNDTQVQGNWLCPLITLIESDAAIGMVGSKLVYPDGQLQEAGGIVWSDGSAWNYGNRQNPESPEFNYVREVDYVSGASLMIRSELWHKIGGFDENFAPAYCEDSDLAFEVRRRGYKVMYQPMSVVVHFEGVSNGTNTDSGQKAYQIVNQKKFLDKWSEVLHKEHFPNGENVFVARDRSQKKPVILMIDHYVPQYDKDAGSRTVYQYLNLFVEKGYNVKFIGDNFYKHEPYTTELQQLGIEVIYGAYYANNWKEWIKSNGCYFNFAFMNRPHISVKYIDYIKENTNAKLIYYGHDLHFLREMRRYELTGDKKALKSSLEWKDKELSLMRKSDVVYYPSNIEVEEIAKIDRSINAKAIIAYIFQNVKVRKYNFVDRSDIMFVGGFVHTPNVDAVIWLAKEILPKVKEEMPNIKIYIVGSNPPQEIMDLANENIIVKGFIADEELRQLYEQCRISIVPLRYGAGIKGKVIEAMRYGMPVLTTSVGAEGIEGAEQILCVANGTDEISKELVALYHDRKRLETMSEQSYNYIAKHYSLEAAWNRIKDDLN